MIVERKRINVVENQRKQSRMDNLETVNSGRKIQNEDKQNTTQITNKKSNMNPTKKMNPGVRKAKQLMFLICHVL